MSDQNAHDVAGHVQSPYGAAETTAAPHRFIDQASSVGHDDEPGVAPQAGLGLYTLREWIVIALGLALTVLSFFSAFSLDVIGGYTPVWGIGITWLGAAFFPFVAVLLIALRRFVPRLRHLGALSLDQLASVAFAVAAFIWLNLAIIVLQISAAISDLYGQFASVPGGVEGMFDLQQSPLRVGVIVWIAFVVALAGVFFTVFARFVPPFSADFAGREETLAHPTARPARPLAKRARAAAPTTAPTWPAAAPAAHGAPQPVHDPSGITRPPAPAADGSVPPVPRSGGATFGQPAPYGHHAPSSYGQESAPPYAQYAPGPYAQEVATPHTQGTPDPDAQNAPARSAESDPAAYSQDAAGQDPAAYAQDAPAQDAAAPFATDVPASDGQDVPPAYGAPAPTDQLPPAEVADATLPVDATPVDDVPVPESAHAVETPETVEPAVEFEAPATAPVDADAPAPYATDSADAPAAAPASDAGTTADGAPAHGADMQPDEVPAAVDAGAPDEVRATVDAGAPDHAPAADASPSATAPGADAAPQAAATPQPFWALAPVERDVHDFDGNPLYRIGPTAWSLVLEDRGSYFVMRHDDGRIGYLHDTSGITRG